MKWLQSFLRWKRERETNFTARIAGTIQNYIPIKESTWENPDAMAGNRARHLRKDATARSLFRGKRGLSEMRIEYGVNSDVFKKKVNYAEEHGIEVATEDVLPLEDNMKWIDDAPSVHCIFCFHRNDKHAYLYDKDGKCYGDKCRVRGCKCGYA